MDRTRVEFGIAGRHPGGFNLNTDRPHIDGWRLTLEALRIGSELAQPVCATDVIKTVAADESFTSCLWLMHCGCGAGVFENSQTAP